MTGSDKVDARLSRVYASKGDQQALYDNWATSYDRDLVDDLGYVAHDEASRQLQALVPGRNARILDAGCGTGLVGRRLRQAGYTEIHGSDYSLKMLDQARASGAYSSLAQHDLTRVIATDAPYDAAIVVGVFAFNLPSVEHLVNITGALKQGGIALVTVNGKAWREVDWPARLEGFDQKYPCTRLLDVQIIDYLTTENIDGRLLTLQRV